MSERTENLMAKMTLREKIGQMCQLTDEGGDYTARIREGTAGSFLNTKDPGRRDALQRIAVEESRLGIPIMFGRDVIHGFRTVFPIPLGQAAGKVPAPTRRQPGRYGGTLHRGDSRPRSSVQ